MINVHICYWHWKMCLERYLNNPAVRLTHDYRNELSMLRGFVKKLFALPFVPAQWPVDFVVDGVRDPRLLLYVQYIREQWMQNPTIPKCFWNCYGNMFRRTNNDVEGWHKAIQEIFTTAHPNLWRHLQEMKKAHKKYRDICLGGYLPVCHELCDVLRSRAGFTDSEVDARKSLNATSRSPT